MQPLTFGGLRPLGGDQEHTWDRHRHDTDHDPAEMTSAGVKTLVGSGARKSIRYYAFPFDAWRPWPRARCAPEPLRPVGFDGSGERRNTYNGSTRVVMTLTVRLPPEVDEQFALVCRRRHITKAEAIARLVRDFIAAHRQHSFYDVAEKLGIVGAEPRSMSRRTSRPPSRCASVVRCVRSIIIADTGPLVALLSRNDRHHVRVKTFFAGAPLRLLATWPCIKEAWHILHTRNRLPLMRWIAGDGPDVFDVRPRTFRSSWTFWSATRNAAMDLADASLVLLASHIGIREILTVDRRDFEVYRLLDGREFVQVLS